MVRGSWVVAIAVLGGPLGAAAQSHSIRGHVRDTEGAPLAGVEVMVESPRRSTTTDAGGAFRIDSLSEGTRRLLVRRIGYLPMHPRVKVPQPAGDTLVITMLQAAQQLAPIVVMAERGGIRGVVGDTGYHALPGTIVEILGARAYQTTDSTGRFAFNDLKQGHYVMRVSREGYFARLLPIDLTREGQEFSILLEQYRPGVYDWGNTREAAIALPDLSARLAMEPKRTRMTRAELARYGTMPLCEIPRIRSLVGIEPRIIMRGFTWMRNADLCAWSADQIDLVEFGSDPCKESWKSIAEVLGMYCTGNRAVSLYATTPARRPSFVVLWPSG